MSAGSGIYFGDAALANSEGNLAMRRGDPSAAEALFAQACRIAPQITEFAINQAIALATLERHEAALSVLDRHASACAGDARYHSVRANSLRALRRLAESAQSYDRSLALAPQGAKALHGRARVAMERGEADAVARFEAALAVNTQDPEAWLGLAEALDAAGETTRARDIAAQLVAQAPHWVEALRFLSQLRLAAGEGHFAAHFAEAERLRPSDPDLARAHVTVLDAHDLHAEALAVAAAAHARMPGDPAMALLEAVQASSAGEDARATALFAELALETPERWLHEARHCLRIGELARCEALLEPVIAQAPGNVSAWAMRDLVWRLAADARADWLHGQDGLVRMLALPDAAAVVAEAVPLLHWLHDKSAFPLGQSLRGGTQTRGNLFDRAEPELARLHSALIAALEDYRAGLAPADPSHPLLRHREGGWAITGSWSVRLAGGGDHHAPHLHPQGLLSSACYLLLPDAVGEEAQAGWIELGRPAPDLRLDLPPLYTLEPKAGHLALFPSTLYHGTRPFRLGQRMTVAFDVTLAGAGH
ncbi:MAG: tetratricopeptide repeat protein [Erythrobacter sp.]|nr:MAG: tetratricopeptide repeat protein [Erythrobacter sp.]